MGLEVIKMDNSGELISAIGRQDKMVMLDAISVLWLEQEKELRFKNEIEELREPLKKIIGSDKIHGVDY